MPAGLTDRETLNVFARELANIPDQPMLINPPRKRLLTYLSINWVILFLGVLMSKGIYLVASGPILIFMFGWPYLKLAKLWKAYGYSRAMLHILTILFFIITLIITKPLRNFLIDVIFLPWLRRN